MPLKVLSGVLLSHLEYLGKCKKVILSAEAKWYLKANETSFQYISEKIFAYLHLSISIKIVFRGTSVTVRIRLISFYLWCYKKMHILKHKKFSIRLYVSLLFAQYMFEYMFKLLILYKCCISVVEVSLGKVVFPLATGTIQICFLK